MSLKTLLTRSLLCRATTLLALATILTIASTSLRAETGTCSGQNLTLHFTDVPPTNVFFCYLLTKAQVCGGGSWDVNEGLDITM